MFDAVAFADRMDQFAEKLLPVLGATPLTLEAMVVLTQRLRGFFDANDVPDWWRRRYAVKFVDSFIGQEQPLSELQRVEIRQRLREALGVDVPVQH